MPNFVVLALKVMDTAVIPAETQEAALDVYELPEEFNDDDILTWAVTEEEFEEVVGGKSTTCGEEDCPNGCPFPEGCPGA